jgi:hypothetical protein
VGGRRRRVGGLMDGQRRPCGRRCAGGQQRRVGGDSRARWVAVGGSVVGGESKLSEGQVCVWGGRVGGRAGR